MGDYVMVLHTSVPFYLIVFHPHNVCSVQGRLQCCQNYHRDIMSTVGDNIFGYLSTFTVLMTSPTCIIISLLSTQITKDDIPHTTEHPYVTQTIFFHLSTSTDWTPP